MDPDDLNLSVTMFSAKAVYSQWLTSQIFLFDAFSGREPVSISLENAMDFKTQAAPPGFAG
jgi:hypothetical protein